MRLYLFYPTHMPIFDSHNSGSLCLGTPGDFARSAYQSGLEVPIEAVAEIWGARFQQKQTYNKSSIAGQAGEIVGATADLLLLSKAADLCLPSLARAAESSALSATLKAGTIGTVYGGVFTPSTSLSGRLHAAVADGVTFGAMGGAAAKLGSFAPAARTWTAELAIGAGSGAVGGLANSAADSIWNRKIESSSQVIGNTLRFAALGGAIGLASRALHFKPSDASEKTEHQEPETPKIEARPVPLRPENAGTALNYHQMPVDMTSPLWNEPLVKASAVGLSNQSYYHIADGSNAPYGAQIPGSLPDVWMRKSIADKLLRINETLAPQDLELHVHDAYRPIETQKALWDHFIEKGRQQLQTGDPETLREFAGHFASEPHGFDPTNPETWPTHNTGASVDVTLRQKSTGKILDMGSGFDEASDASFTDTFEKNAGNIESRNNRRTLHQAMIDEGFTNYPYEWWHYDFGTQMWLQNSDLLDKGVKAWYGPATLPS